MSFRVGPEMNVANPTPTPPPASIHGPQSFRNEMLTEPSLWCVKAALADATYDQRRAAMDEVYSACGGKIIDYFF